MSLPIAPGLRAVLTSLDVAELDRRRRLVLGLPQVREKHEPRDGEQRHEREDNRLRRHPVKVSASGEVGMNGGLEDSNVPAGRAVP
jgi:hypothetical protein